MNNESNKGVEVGVIGPIDGHSGSLVRARGRYLFALSVYLNGISIF